MRALQVCVGCLFVGLLACSSSNASSGLFSPNALGDSVPETCVASPSVAWRNISAEGAPSPRTSPEVARVGDSVVVVGGRDDRTNASGGGIYNLCADTWTALPAGGPALEGVGSSAAAPSPSTGPRHVVFWGSTASGGPLVAHVLDPAVPSWTPMIEENAPASRQGDVRVWAGEKLVVWGGFSRSIQKPAAWLRDGGIFEPQFNRWTKITEGAAPTARSAPLSVWTGSRVLLWGGSDPEGKGPSARRTDGSMFDPETNAWTPVSAVGAPTFEVARLLWTGTRVVVWGRIRAQKDCTSKGCGSTTRTIDVASFDPIANVWYPVTTPAWSDALEGTPALGGRRVLVVGSQGQGLILDPEAGSWTPTSEVPRPARSYGIPAVKTAGGRILLEFAGLNNNGIAAAPAFVVFDGSTSTFTELPALEKRQYPGVLWTGRRVVLFGGADVQRDPKGSNGCDGFNIPEGVGCDPVEPTISVARGDGVSFSLP